MLFRAVAARCFFAAGSGEDDGESSAACLRFPRCTVCAIVALEQTQGGSGGRDASVCEKGGRESDDARV